MRREARYYGVVVPGIVLCSRLPWRFTGPLGYLLGTVGWLVAGRERGIARENLRHAFGEGMTPAEVRRVTRGVFRSVVTNVLEVAAVQRWPPERIRRHFDFHAEFERIQGLLPGGAIVVAAHLGNWELLALLYAAYLPGRPIPVARRLSFGKFQRLAERLRGGAGLETIYTDESPRKFLEAIRGGKLLGILADQDLRVVNGVFVDFFGRPAYTLTMPVSLALSTGAPLGCCYLVREARRFRLIAEVIPLERTGRRGEDLIENTRRWSAFLEAEIRKRPAQWVWFHRRWRTRPGSEPRSKRGRSTIIGAGRPGRPVT